MSGWGAGDVPAKRVCSEPTCPRLTDGGRCDEHRRQADRARGTRQQRGYDAEHDRRRARWAPLVVAGAVNCARRECGLPIGPGEAWDLGHNDERTDWTGPEHATCNRVAAGRAAHT